jgi:hypothetical protein
VGQRTFVEPLGPEEAVMPATPSLTNVILGGIAAGLVAAHLFAGATSPATSTDDQVADVLVDSGHAHKGDRLPLFHAQGPSVTVAAPSVTLFGVTETDSGTRPNTSVALKNVVVVARVIDFDAATAPKRLDGAVPDKQDPARASPKAMSCKVLAEPKLALGRVGIRCFA